jgi:hypothetical protein
MKAKARKAKPAARRVPARQAKRPDFDFSIQGVLEPLMLSPDSKERSKSLKLFAAFVFVACVALLNFASSLIALYLALPLYLDTWATSAAVMMCGLWAGTSGGMLYNILMTYLLWSPSAWVWMLSSAWVAFATWMLYRDGWIGLANPKKLVAAGAIIGITNTFVVVSISLVAFGTFPEYANTLFVKTALNSIINNPAISSFFEVLLANLADKIITVGFAAMIVARIPKRYKAYFRKI